MEKTFVELFPKRLHTYMVKYQITQRDLAQRMGVSEASVSNWIKGVKIPRTDKIDKLCVIFNCSYSDLISEPDVEIEVEPAEADSTKQELMDIYDKLNPDGQSHLLKLAKTFLPDQ